MLGGMMKDQIATEIPHQNAAGHVEGGVRTPAIQMMVTPMGGQAGGIEAQVGTAGVGVVPGSITAAVGGIEKGGEGVPVETGDGV